VPPARLAAYLRDLSALLKKYDYKTVLYGHFGEGCVHCRMDWDLLTADGIAKWKRFLEEAAELVISYGGSLSGEHGDGQARGWLLPKMFGEELVAAFREFKAIWDPEGRMNPGKVVDPDPVDANLRLGTAYRPAEPATRFRFPADQGSFARAALRCVGAGVCRRQEGGLMCPSYRATRDERETTRGRARLLFEMLRGDPVAGGWRSLEVKEALDLCLACKGCKGECPVNVDMASYKAEFFSHFYEGRLRPREAYAFGLVGRWAPLAARAPRLANAAAHAPGLGGLLKLLVGIHPARHIPALAPQSFRRWFARRARSQGDGPAVLLWADTFNNYFRPQTAIAAVEVLEAAGFRVEVDERPFCCGRPLYDYGMLPTAKSWLSRIVTALAPRLRAGMPVVVLEPSCASVFRDELLNFFPEDEDAQRLARQTFLLSEILERSAPGWQPPRLGKKAIVQGHCHQQAVLRMDDERAVLGRLGLDFEVLDSGCCGMAGAFGFERRHYDVAQQIGERVLLPAVRQAAPETLILADGFSCREQIAQSTGRQALHLAEVLRMAMHEGSA
ncbi:MAG TPA: FAD-linked oxidase C-terminal domain-containing protein, partial [Thermoanaerobaculia bacterium]|nr:FAD-linked oxidase C-terminal domain-containing protein [Thermoanaerobaculia bacterium]